MAIVICITMRKGGTGKTCTIVNLAGMFSLDGKKTLVVDTDTQGGCTDILTGYPTETTQFKGRGLYEMILHYGDDNFNVRNYISPTNVENVDIIPANSRSVHVAQQMELFSSDDEELENAFIGICLNEIIDEYDYILIDTAPADDIILHNAINASDYALIPYKLDGSWASYFAKTYKIIQNIKRKEECEIEVLGICFTMVNKRTTQTKMVLDDVKESEFATDVMETVIRQGQAANDETSYKLPAVIADKASNVSQDYEALYKEIMKRLEARKNG